MHIIFGKENSQGLNNKYTVLELDTFYFPDKNIAVPAYCIVENVSILELSQLEQLKTLHADLISNYSKKNWKFCLDAIEQLEGKLGGELDTFYQDLGNRINKLKDQVLDDTWSPVIVR
jgi:hypothetical protein